MITFGLFILMGTDSSLNSINPLYMISNQLLIINSNELIKVVLISGLVILLSIPSIINYTCVSNERR